MMPLLFFAFWIILNGRVTMEIVIFGAVISLGVFFLQYKLSNGKVGPVKSIYIFGIAIIYIFVLILEILKATFNMAVAMLFKSGETPSAIVSFDSPLVTEFAQVVLANSITLTPGTISVELENGKYRVHCYVKDMAKGITQSNLVKLLKAAEASIAKEGKI